MASSVRARPLPLIVLLALLFPTLVLPSSPAIAASSRGVQVGTKEAGTFTAGPVVVPEGAAGSMPFAVEATGFASSDPTGQRISVHMALPAGAGTLSVTDTTGLILSHGYPSFNAVSELSFWGELEDVTTALSDHLVWNHPSSPTGPIAIDVVVQQRLTDFYYSPSNGHYYRTHFAGGEISWHDAALWADTTTVSGMHGYLATVTSAAENEFIATHIPDYEMWIGAADSVVRINEATPGKYADQDEAEGNWHWVTGPEAGTQFWSGDGSTGAAVGGAFAAWGPGEPDNDAGDQHYALINRDGAGLWADNGRPGAPSWFLVEFGGMPGDTPNLPFASTAGEFEVAINPPSVATPPTVGGENVDGSTLQADPGEWNDPTADFEFQWIRCDGDDTCNHIDGATSDTYQLTSNEIGWRVGVAVTASNAGGNTLAIGMPEPAVAPKKLRIVSDVAIVGTPEPGEQLSATGPLWDGSGDIDGSYRWQRCFSEVCVDIPAARSATYRVTDSDSGLRIRVVASVADGYGNTVESSDVTDGAVGPGTPAFVDVGYGHVFFGDVQWLAAEGITRGCNPPLNDRYCPEVGLTRAQMATFLVRAFDLPSTDRDMFTDDSAGVHQDDINALGASGITLSCNPGGESDRFCPDRLVTRAELASFLVRALRLSPVTEGPFTDTAGNVHAAAIDALAGAGISAGCNPDNGGDRYCPDDPVTRGQAAAMIHRAYLTGMRDR